MNFICMHPARLKVERVDLDDREAVIGQIRSHPPGKRSGDNAMNHRLRG
jgi:hypothetical protein